MDSFFIKILGPLAVITFTFCAFLYKENEKAREIIDYICRVLVVVLMVAFFVGVIVASYFYFPVAIAFIIVMLFFMGLEDNSDDNYF